LAGTIFGKDAVFEGRDKLLALLKSKNTTDAFTLDMIRTFFNVSKIAHNSGVDLSSVDTLGAKISISGGTGGFGGVSADAVLNLTSGEFSYYGSLEGGLVIGATATLVGGISMLKNMPSNNGYSGTFKSFGVMGGDVIGVNVEHFTGGVHKNQTYDDVPDGTFVGVGGAVPEPNIGVYGSMSYSIEILNVNAAGYSPISEFPNPIAILKDIGDVLEHDILKIP